MTKVTHPKLASFVLARRLYHIRCWNESKLLVDRRSKFQGRCCRITNVGDVMLVLNELLKHNKTVAKASHQHIYAWRTADVTADVIPKSLKDKTKRTQSTTELAIKNLNQGCADCGEAGAGSVLLRALERSQIVNVLLIVTRWYGGTPLGPKRFRNISSVAVESLKKGGFINSASI
ncbi:HCL047Cp [Eremothecium sinecaudum]|uniref:HCL047Cp n=1 Tax=Eremothecium sinecaudum TaxID=45286 RepID=A0A0X8HRI0_9SACH|nr:HCL047Cp [Eremothecium sinecaudum]AMD20104.1 HCL047Cp [Eremothecium sinecaudum]